MYPYPPGRAGETLNRMSGIGSPIPCTGRGSLRERWRRWNQLAYLSLSERRLNQGLWALLAAALVVALFQHILFVNLEEVFRGGARIGSVLYDLSIAYAGAFTFYALNIRLPLRRDRRNIYRTVGPLIDLVVMHGDQLMTILNKAARIEPPDRENTWPNIKDMCGKIKTDTQAEGMFFGTQGIGQNTVFTVIVDRMNRTRSGIEKILSFSSFLATDLIDLLSAFETADTHFRTFSEHVAIVQSTGIPVVNSDMSMWSHQIFNYANLIQQLKDYRQRYLLAAPQPRPGMKTYADVKADSQIAVPLSNPPDQAETEPHG
jgi:hypothetical protein